MSSSRVRPTTVNWCVEGEGRSRKLYAADIGAMSLPELFSGREEKASGKKRENVSATQRNKGGSRSDKDLSNDCKANDVAKLEKGAAKVEAIMLLSHKLEARKRQRSRWAKKQKFRLSHVVGTRALASSVHCMLWWEKTLSPISSDRVCAKMAYE